MILLSCSAKATLNMGRAVADWRIANSTLPQASQKKMSMDSELRTGRRLSPHFIGIESEERIILTPACCPHTFFSRPFVPPFGLPPPKGKPCLSLSRPLFRILASEAQDPPESASFGFSPSLLDTGAGTAAPGSHVQARRLALLLALRWETLTGYSCLVCKGSLLTLGKKMDREPTSWVKSSDPSLSCWLLSFC